MIIKVLGSGCKKCKELLKRTQEAVSQMGISAEVIYVTDMQEIIQSGVMSTPALIIDDKIKVKGRLPKVKEIIDIISNS